MRSGGVVDPTPLSPAQIQALLFGAARELSWGLYAVSCETRKWRLVAEAIPDAPLREDALRSLEQKRGHADGAALFTILPRRRNRELLNLLVAYETIWDFLDNVSERHPTPLNGEQLQRAIIEAVDPTAPLSDYYLHHPWKDDGGYLAALVMACQRHCRSLPSFTRVEPLVRRETRRAVVLGINHDVDAARRDAALRAWAAHEYPTEQELSWFELSGAASASLLAHVLLTLAAKSTLTEREINEAYSAHWPWIALATTMLDSYADQVEDAVNGNHSYIAHYADPDAAITRLCHTIRRALEAARGLTDGHRHTVIVACMIALYLSKESTRLPQHRANTARLIAEGGTLVRVLVPILRAWRIAYRQRSA